MVDAFAVRLVEVGVAGRPGVVRLVLEPARSWSTSGRWSGYSTASPSSRSRAASMAAWRAWFSSRRRPVPATSPSRPMTHGSVSPWPTSVARITQKVRKMMRFRSGNGVGAIGSASAAASETAPRIPAQAMTTTAARGGDGSRSRIRALRTRGRYVAGKTHTMRATITVRLMATPSAMSSPVRVRGEPFDDVRELEADEHEQEAVDQEVDDGPDAGPEQPTVGREGPSGASSGDQTGRDRREDPADADRLRRQVRGDRRDQRQDDLERRVPGAAPRPGHEQADDDADGDPADPDDDERDAGVKGGERPGQRRPPPPPDRRSARTRR